ncbi:hypothetical protein AB0399_16685 [Streptomyces sp. NPDC088194]|uniref:hypothetical protein n=1 Tax=Streptomyces sp. NPDC088194 TaxID=3154931 RepID=UPI00344DCD21
MAFVFIPSQAASMDTITKARTGQASSIFNAGKQLGGAIGVALLSAVLAAVGPTQEEAGHVDVHLTAYHDAFLAAAAAATLAVAVALAIHDADASTTMTRRRNPRAAERQAEEPAVAAEDG